MKKMDTTDLLVKQGSSRVPWGLRMLGAVQRIRNRAERLMGDDEGQGTTEYAVLVGVLVVIAIAAVVLFRDKIQSLWNEIASSINSL